MLMELSELLTSGAVRRAILFIAPVLPISK